ncbi:5-formyltetrahydrofolate cyclo-ligase [Demequina sp. NBRC 110056]|uniref:5-formyltetrahydrofolate cyclo-ligase n=1 Tax=Demequina sp. NBRC 110056 TaxID=1570345 RepID=UPI000A0567E7|nr:5-formyltetrahydrofolate cyclo-ligase [Demequina sp. NBRC 110056]
MSTSQRGTRAPAPEDAKAQLRTSIRKARLHRSERRREELAQLLRDHVLAMPEIGDAQCVSVYASRAHEPGTLPLIEALYARGVRILVPRLGDGLQRGWSPYQGADDLIERAPGRPPEPSGEFLGPEAIDDADVVIVPALAVDSRGTRLGQGGGWYDRALEGLDPRVPIVALTFAAEFRGPDELPLPRESHDIGVHAVITPEGMTDLTA